jgi:hypothetical protein
MKYQSILVILFSVMLGCATYKEPLLEKSQALSIGIDYAKAHGWDVKNIWNATTFQKNTGEWQMFFDIQHRHGPYIVYVNDKTKAVRFEQGE